MFEVLDKEDLVPYLAPVTQRLFVRLQTPGTTPREAGDALRTLGAVASAAQEEFGP
jgi:hypothetical protein